MSQYKTGDTMHFILTDLKISFTDTL